MDSAKDGDRRRAKRLRIECPVTVGIQSKGNGHGQEQGQLYDICIKGARFFLGRFVAVDTNVTLHVHFRNPDGAVTRIRFEGVVTRAMQGPPHEIAVSFRRGGRFLRREFEELFRSL